MAKQKKTVRRVEMIEGKDLLGGTIKEKLMKNAGGQLPALDRPVSSCYYKK